MFVGTYEHALDEKGRLVLPLVFRNHLAERAYVTQWEGCLGVWTEEGFEDVAERFREKVRAKEAPQSVLRSFSATAQEVKPDGQGRILLPPRLRTFAGLGTQVMVIGNLDHVEIWDAERYRREAEAADQSFTDHLGVLGL